MKVGDKMLKDVLLPGMPSGNWQYAKNIIISKKYGAVSNEDGWDELCELTIIIGFITTNEEDIVFIHTEALNESVVQTSGIYRIKDGECSCIIEDTALGFFYPIEGAYHYDDNGDLIIVWWDGVYNESNPPKILNVDNLPFEVDGNCALVNPTDINLIRLNPTVNDIDFDIEVLANGGNLPSGVYFLRFAYVYADGSNSPYFDGSNPVSIYSDNFTDDIHQIEGDPPDTTTTKAIVANLTSLDPSFAGVKAAVISKIGGVVTVYETDSVDISATGLAQINISNLTSLSISELAAVLVPTTSFHRVQAGAVVHKRLHFGNYIINNAPADLQPYINNVKVKWVYEEEASLSEFDTSYKNPVFILNKRGFRSNEVMGFYLIVNLDTGERAAFHIPGRAAGPIPSVAGQTEDVTIQTLIDDEGFSGDSIDEMISIDPDARYYQFFNTAASNGTMGFWENRNETYPDNECMDIKDSGGSVIGTLRNKNVRHHKFPSLRQLNDWNLEPFTEVDADVDIWFKIVKLGYSQSIMTHTIETDNTGGSGTFDTGNWRYTAEETLYLRVDASMNWDGAGPSVDSTFKHIRGGVDIVEDSQSGDSFVFTHFVVMLPGDIIEFRIFSAAERNPSEESFIRVWDLKINKEVINQKILGVQLTDISFPADIQSRIVSYELGYAQRDSINTTIFSQCVIKRDSNVTDTTIVSHPKDALISKINPSFDYIDVQIESFDRETIYTNYASFTAIRKIASSEYVPADVNSPINNLQSEEKLYNTLDLPYPTHTVPWLGLREPHFLVDMKYHRTDIYSSFEDQVVVSTGFRFAPNVNETSFIYGGDNFISLYADCFYINFLVDNLSRTFIFYGVESFMNLGLQHSIEGAFHAPKHFQFDEDAPIGTNVGYSPTDQIGPGNEYNTDYSSVNNVVAVIVNECSDDPDQEEGVSLFPYAIARSIVQNDEVSEFNWRTFLVNDYYQMPKDRGPVWVLRNLNKALMIQMKYDLYIARIKDTFRGDLEEVVLGRGDIFTSQPDTIIPSDKGYIGCGNKWAAIVCKAGYFVADGVQGKVFQYNGQAKEISNKVFKQWFIKNLSTIEFLEDNPFVFSGLMLGFDEQNNRLLLTAIIRNIKNNEIVVSESYTLSYSIDSEAWTSNHEYLPSGYFHNVRGLFAIDNDAVFTSDRKGRIWQMNVANKKGMYHWKDVEGDQIIYPSYVDIVINEGKDFSKIWESISWRTIVEDNAAILSSSTITHIMVYTNSQCTGLIEVRVHESINRVNTNTKELTEEWSFNDVYDLVINRDSVIIDSDGNINIANLDTRRSWYDRGNIVNPWIAVRLYYDNLAQKDIHIYEISAKIRAAIKNIQNKL